MANAFWCIVEDDRQGVPKKGMAEGIGEAARLGGGPGAGGGGGVVRGAGRSRQREFVARLAARLGVGLAADCVAFAMDGDRLVATRPVYAGKLLAKVAWARGPWVATLRPNVFRPVDAQAGRAAAVERPAPAAPP